MTLTAPVRRRTRPCVRCGLGPRHEDTFLCVECRCSHITFEEAARAMRADPEHPRLALMQAGWKGGWGR